MHLTDDYSSPAPVGVNSSPTSSSDSRGGEVYSNHDLGSVAFSPPDID